MLVCANVDTDEHVNSVVVLDHECRSTGVYASTTRVKRPRKFEVNDSNVAFRSFEREAGSWSAVAHPSRVTAKSSRPSTHATSPHLNYLIARDSQDAQALQEIVPALLATGRPGLAVLSLRQAAEVSRAKDDFDVAQASEAELEALLEGFEGDVHRHYSFHGGGRQSQRTRDCLLRRGRPGKPGDCSEAGTERARSEQQSRFEDVAHVTGVSVRRG